MKKFLLFAASAILLIAVVTLIKSQIFKSDILAMNVDALTDTECQKGPFKHKEWVDCDIVFQTITTTTTTSTDAHVGVDAESDNDTTKVSIGAGVSRESNTQTTTTTSVGPSKGKKSYCLQGGWMIICKEDDCR